MKKNNKIVILGVLIIVVVFTWIPKGAKPAKASADTSEADHARQEISATVVVSAKKSEFVDWGRDPFSFSQGVKTGDVSNMSLHAIMWDAENPSAYINDLIVIVGDRIADKTVKQIEKTRVTLTDQKTDYVLELKKEW